MYVGHEDTVGLHTATCRDDATRVWLNCILNKFNADDISLLHSAESMDKYYYHHYKKEVMRNYDQEPAECLSGLHRQV